MKNLISSFLKAGFIQSSNRFSFVQTKSLMKAKFTTFNGSQGPNEIPEEVKKMMESQNQNKRKKSQEIPILKDISEVKSMEQLQRIFQKMYFMSKDHREIAVRYLLSGIYQQSIPIEAINYKPLEAVLKEFPQLKLETEIFQINILVKKINKIREESVKIDQNQSISQENGQKLRQLFNRINNLYYKSFNQTLKTIPSEHLTRSKATLYKHFAEYNFDYLFNPIITQKGSQAFQVNESVLKKSRQFLIQSLKHHKQILLNEHKKLDSDEIKKLKEEDSDRHDIRLSAIKENIRKIVESIGECLYAYFKVINKEHRMLKDPEEHKKRKIELLSLIDSHIPLYSVIPGIKQLSMMYYKLYKLKIEARFTAIGEPKTPEEVKAKIKETIEDYSRLYKECQDCLDESIEMDNFNNIKEISTTIICNFLFQVAIKYMMGRTVRKDENDIKNNLALQVKTILDKTKKEFKQPLQTYLLKIIKEMLNLKA